MIYAIIYLVLSCIGLGMSIAKHGEPKGNYNFWADLIAEAIVLWLLYMAGFFDVFKN